MARNGFHGKEVAAQLHRRTCTGVCVIFMVSVVCTKQESWAPVRACRCIRSAGVFDIRAHICDTIIAGCAHALVYAQFVHSRWGTRVGGFNWSMQSTCRLEWGFIFDRRRDRGVVLCLLYFWRGWECTCVYVCVHTHTHTHCTWGTRCEPRGRDETPAGPEESRWNKFRHICPKKKLRTQIYMDLRNLDPQAKVLNYCFK